MEADIVIVNHHLFFSDITLKTEGFGELLPAHEAVIFDEAHTIPDIASKFFGFSVSSFQLSELIVDIELAEKVEKSGVQFSDEIEVVEACLNRFQVYCKTVKRNAETLNDLISHKFDQVYDDLYESLTVLGDMIMTASAAGEELEKCCNRTLQFIAQLETWRNGREKNSVSWFESGKNFFRFHVTPLNVGEHFNRFLDSPQISWVFTSATLAVGDDFSAFANDIGLLDAQTHRWESPYDYRTNSLLYLPDHLPDPRDSSYYQGITDIIMDVTNASKGRAFCLFTSYAMMDRVYQELKDKSKWPLLLQGAAAKQHLLDQFLDTENSILLGTSSFWEGVDVKGDALSCVIIDKLPFEPPSDPVLKSKLRICEENEGIPFMEIQVPNAVIALKQGAGRLIRSETDRGVLVICDPRISTKSYGKLFLKSLPAMPVTRSADDVYAFFS